MKPLYLALAAALAVSACAEYQPATANCFSGGDTVSRNQTSMSFLSQVDVASRNAHSTGDCDFIPLGGASNG